MAKRARKQGPGKDSEPGTTFGRLLKRVREAKDLTQLQLATKSRVSTRTISELESPQTHKQPRKDVVIRLALALEEDPVRWLREAGYDEIGEPQIESLVKDVRPDATWFPGECSPEDYFEEVAHKLEAGAHIVMYVCYLSPPGALYRPEVEDQVIRLLSNGLWLAMVCPYPSDTATLRAQQRISLASFYQHVYDSVQACFLEYRSGLNKDQRNHVRLFRPNANQNTPLVPPNLGLAEYRPALIQTTNAGTDQPTYDLGAWVRIFHERRDRWIRIWPRPSHEEQGQIPAGTLRSWKDYFGEIRDAWTPNHGWQAQPMDSWSPVDID